MGLSAGARKLDCWSRPLPGERATLGWNRGCPASLEETNSTNPHEPTYKKHGYLRYFSEALFGQYQGCFSTLGYASPCGCVFNLALVGELYTSRNKAISWGDCWQAGYQMEGLLGGSLGQPSAYRPSVTFPRFFPEHFVKGS